MSALPALAALALAVRLLLLRRRAARRAEQVARACHELRGPLHAAGLALHNVAGRGPHEQVRVRAASLELERAALALADLDRAALGRAALSARKVHVDLGALVSGHAAAWHALAREHGALLRVQLPARPAVVAGDPVRLAQALANLVANAAEHGAGPVSLRVQSACEGEVVVEVSDHGTGLARPIGALIARPRAGRGHRGRGLAISAQIAADHGGRLAAAPSAAGARLRLALPAERGHDSVRAAG